MIVILIPGDTAKPCLNTQINKIEVRITLYCSYFLIVFFFKYTIKVKSKTFSLCAVLVVCQMKPMQKSNKLSSFNGQ